MLLPGYLVPHETGGLRYVSFLRNLASMPLRGRARWPPQLYEASSSGEGPSVAIVQRGAQLWASAAWSSATAVATAATQATPDVRQRRRARAASSQSAPVSFCANSLAVRRFRLRSSTATERTQ